MLGREEELGSDADVFAEMAVSLAELAGVGPTLDGVVEHSLRMVPCDWAAAAATGSLGDAPPSLAATTDDALLGVVATIAGGCSRTPGRDAFRSGAMVYSNDLQTDHRWPEYCEAIVRSTPIRSVLSFGLRLNQNDLGVLTFYASSINAFDDRARNRGHLLARHAAVAVDSATSADSARNLEAALQTSRDIGAAIGVLVERYRVTPEHAFSMLRTVSSQTNRKLVTIAEELLHSGELGPS